MDSFNGGTHQYFQECLLDLSNEIVTCVPVLGLLIFWLGPHQTFILQVHISLNYCEIIFFHIILITMFLIITFVYTNVHVSSEQIHKIMKQLT